MITLSHSPVHSHPAVLSGTLTFRGTRVPVQTLVDYLNDGVSFQSFLENFPSVKKEDAVDFLSLLENEAHENYSG